MSFKIQNSLKQICQRLRLLTSIFLLMFANNTLFANPDITIDDPWQVLQTVEHYLQSADSVAYAKSVANQVLEIAKSQKDDKLNQEASLALSLVYYSEGNYDEAVEILNELLEKVSSEDEMKVAKINKALGNAHVYLGNYAKAYSYQLDALDYFNSIADEHNAATLYFSIGNNLFYQEQYELALDKFKTSLKIFKKLENDKGTYWALGAIGSVHEYLGNLDQAMEISNQSLKLAYDLDEPSDIAWTLYNIGSIATTSNKLEEALSNLLEAKKLATEINDKPLLGYILEALTITYSKKNEYKTALKHLDESYAIAIKNNEKANIPNLYKLYSNIHFSQKNYEESRMYISKYISLKDSLRNEELSSSMGDLKKDFQMKELERKKEIELLKKDVEINNFRRITWMISIVFTVLIMVAVLLFFRTKNKHVKEKNYILQSTNEKILRQNEILKNSNRDLKQYSYIISHDLKEPLRNISSFTTLLKRKLGSSLDSESMEYMEFITGGVTQMHSLLTDLLEYSKVRKKSKEAPLVDAQEVVEKVLDSIKFNIESEKAIVNVAALPKVYIEKNHLYQVVLNIVSNGIKFSGDKSPQIDISCKELKDEYVFSIKDNGIGIDMEFKDKVFIVFQRLNNRKEYSGSGIGLSTCKKIISDYGGQIWVDSTPGQGSEFHFSIPKNPTDQMFVSVPDTLKTPDYSTHN